MNYILGIGLTTINQIETNDNVFTFASSIDIKDLGEIERLVFGNHTVSKDQKSSITGKLTISNCNELTTLIIGNNGFMNVRLMDISDLGMLNKVVIGTNTLIEMEEFKATNLKKLRAMNVGEGSLTNIQKYVNI